MRRFAALALLSMLSLLPGLAWPAPLPDDAFQAAREAYTKGDRAKLARAAVALERHPLQPWADYFGLSLALKSGTDEGVTEFLARHADSYVAEKLRGEWIRWLAEQHEWLAVREQFAQLKRPNDEARCHALSARLELGDPEVPAAAQELLAAAAPLAASCHAPLGRLAASGALPAEALWSRLLSLGMQNKLKELRVLAGWLPADEAPPAKALENAIEQPARLLARLPARFAEQRRERALAALAVLRMTRVDPRIAAQRWQDIGERFPAAERGFVWSQLALAGARAHLTEAGEWFAQAEKFGATLDTEQQAWRIRASLRAGDWLAVLRACALLPAPLATQPEWLYWRARAVAALGKPEDANGLFVEIAGQPDFYGILASEALGRPLSLPERAVPPTAEERQAAETNPALVRGLALIRADLRLDGIREWNWALAGMTDRQLLAAADFARRSEVLDRAINTADRTQAEHDFAQRYPTPFIAQVAPRVREVDLDPAWVYGLMRQESRFIMDARSSAGAKGLMQLMPATAKWVAKKIGMGHYRPGKVTDMDTNVTLGTRYMRMVLDSLDDHPLLASAAYNAGPGRARKWRAEAPLEGAIYAETIPFDETRDYVKKVMSNTMLYATVMGRAGPTLTARLGTIRPRGFGDNTVESLP